VFVRARARARACVCVNIWVYIAKCNESVLNSIDDVCLWHL